MDAISSIPLTKYFYFWIFFYLKIEIESFFFQFSISAIESNCILIVTYLNSLWKRCCIYPLKGIFFSLKVNEDIFGSKGEDMSE